MRLIPRLLATLPLCAAVACADAKPVVRTAADMARDLCAVVMAQRNGISSDEAVKTFCATERQLEPWIDLILAAEKQVEPKAEAASQ